MKIIYSENEIISSDLAITFNQLISFVKDMDKEFITMSSSFISSIFSCSGGIAFQVFERNLRVLSLTKTYNLNLLNKEMKNSRDILKNIILVDKDYLTGFLKRSSLISSSFTYKYLIIMDIDNFKQINDIKGHLEGDRVISFCSLALREFFYNSQFFRYGGDEFVILTNISKVSIDKAMAKVNSKLREFNKTLSISYGISSETRIIPALSEADNKLYKSKHSN